tara:strand:- start:563 stop:1174 length:612 start_codon:yes stop_codon:yes gene_type:complete
MKSFSEIDIISKRASRALGYSWGISEEIGKNIRLLEMFGLQGVKNFSAYCTELKSKKFQNITVINKKNYSKKSSYCPITLGVNFLDQVKILDDLIDLEFQNIGFPLLLVPFISRASEVVGKKIFLQFDNKEFLLNFNHSIFTNFANNEVIYNSESIKIKFLNNKDSFTESEWKNLLTLSYDTFVDENEELKKSAAGAGLTDND